MKFVEPMQDLNKISGMKKSCWPKEKETTYFSRSELVHLTEFRIYFGSNTTMSLMKCDSLNYYSLILLRI